MKKIALYGFVIAAAVLTSCQVENASAPVEETQAKELTPMSFVANLPSDTKTSLLEGNKLAWAETDKISVFSIKDYQEGTYTGSSKYTEYNFSVFTPDAAGSSVTISGEIEANPWDEYYAVYPSASKTGDDWQQREDFMQINISGGKESGRTIRHALPEKQSGTGEENILIAKYDKEKGSFDFNIQTSLFKFTVPAELDGKLSKIILVGNNGEQVVAWSNINVSTRNTSLYEQSFISDVYMENEDGIAAGTYYFVVMPRVYTKGVTIITFDKNGAKYNSKEFSKEINMRGAGATSSVQYGGKVINLGSLPTENDVTVTVLAHWLAEDSEYVNGHSPEWATKGIALPEEDNGSVMTYHSESGNTGLTFVVSGDGYGHYAMKQIVAGDSYEYRVPVSNVPAGSVIRYQTAYSGVSQCPKYWVIKYSLDNGVNWANAETDPDLCGTTTGGNYYNTSLASSGGVVVVNASFEVPSAISSGTVLIRHEVVETTGIGTYSKTKATVRNRGNYKDKDGIAQHGPIITMEVSN